MIIPHHLPMMTGLQAHHYHLGMTGLLLPGMTTGLPHHPGMTGPQVPGGTTIK